MGSDQFNLEPINPPTPQTGAHTGNPTRPFARKPFARNHSEASRDPTRSLGIPRRPKGNPKKELQSSTPGPHKEAMDCPKAEKDPQKGPPEAKKEPQKGPNKNNATRRM